MRKATAALFLVMTILLPAFGTWSAVNQTADGLVEAYKELPPSALMNFSIKISNSKQTEILGSSMMDRIEESDLTNKKMNNALTIDVSTNRRNPIKVTLWFSPFTSSASTGNKMVKTTWKKESTTIPDWISQEQVLDENQDPVNRVFRVGDTKYRYKMAVSTTSNGSAVSQVSASNSVGAEMEILFTPKAQQSEFSGGAWGGWTDTGVIPSTETGVLPGLWEGSTSEIAASVRLSMTMDKAISDLPANVKYIATVRITIEEE